MMLAEDPVSDALMWAGLFPSKWQRIAVTAAGPFSTLVFAGMGGILWRMSAPGHVWHALGLMLLLGTVPSTITNLNPFVEFDGYYMVSDYFGIPNLRKRAFAYSRAWLAARLRRSVER